MSKSPMRIKVLFHHLLIAPVDEIYFQKLVIILVSRCELRQRKRKPCWCFYTPEGPQTFLLSAVSKQLQGETFLICLFQVSLEKVLGITATSGSALTSDPTSGLVAYPAG